MLINKFEEKVAEFVLEQGWISNQETANEEWNFFSFIIYSNYKHKVIDFRTTCENIHFEFSLQKSNLSDLFDEAFKTIKTMGTIVPRKNKKK